MSWVKSDLTRAVFDSLENGRNDNASVLSGEGIYILDRILKTRMMIWFLTAVERLGSVNRGGHAAACLCLY